MSSNYVKLVRCSFSAETVAYQQKYTVHFEIAYQTTKQQQQNLYIKYCTNCTYYILYIYTVRYGFHRWLQETNRQDRCSNNNSNNTEYYLLHSSAFIDQMEVGTKENLYLFLVAWGTAR